MLLEWLDLPIDFTVMPEDYQQYEDDIDQIVIDNNILKVMGFQQRELALVKLLKRRELIIKLN